MTYAHLCVQVYFLFELRLANVKLMECLNCDFVVTVVW